MGMGAGGIHGVELIVLVLLILVVALAALAKRLEIPYPIILVIGGLILSVVPHGPHVELNPEIVFLVILPPLLFSAAWLTPWRDFRYNLVSISMLAVGLVGFTVFGVAAASRWILPGFDWRMGLVLGAVVSTTDAIAATSIASRLGMPKRIVQVLEGESLLNDATGLLALEFTTAMLVTGRTPSLFEGAWRLLYLIFGSIAIGLVAGKLIHMLVLRIVDAPIEITISLIAPYFAYLAAESAHASGVMATVACGLYLGHKSSLFLSTGARLTGEAVWETLVFVLNGFVFLLLGFQLPYIRADIHTHHLGKLVLLGLLFSGVVILLRFLWVYPGAAISYAIRRSLLHQHETVPKAKALFVVSWTGMRGVVALAAAISLPKLLDSGAAFPGRNLMIFLTFCVIFVTLVLQGLTLPALIRRLGLAGQAGRNEEEEEARRDMVKAALAYLEHGRDDASEEGAPVYEELIRLYRRRLNTLVNDSSAELGSRPEDYQLWRELSQQVRAIQRATVLHLRNQNRINDEVMRRLERELDLTEARYAQSESA
ncbi:MAG TPA: Na+/H+ antiporter [Candidatus Acidoferrales bacterium]|jgi:CPA1 family monovalent cation:H+ antiporter|nr:Na+/H+ antiporter [Candidatus Acidoferrales bacterium]